MRTAIALLAVSFAGLASGTLPPPTDDAKAKAAEAAAKAAWDDKVAAYKLCVAIDRTADAYRKSQQAAGAEPSPPPVATPPCADPGPYASQVTPATSKPLEASGAHSPPGVAMSPPSTRVTAAEIPKGAQQ